MRRYFFDVLLDDRIGDDIDGQVLPDSEAVQEEALHTMAKAAKELAEFPASLQVQVRDNEGPIMRIKVTFEIDRAI